jgi:hypothetical protein
MKRFALVAGIVTLVSLAASSAFAQSSGSFAGDFASVGIIPTIACAATDPALSCSDGGAAFLGATIKMPNGKSLLIGGSLETSLLTSTSGTGGKGNQSSTATGAIVVRPEVVGSDGRSYNVYPPRVTFDSRTQTLTANLSGCLTNPDPATGLPVVTCTDPESIALLLSTTSAHSFQFIAPALPQGVYKVMLHVGVTADATTTSIGFNSRVNVGVGAGSLTAQIVHVQTPFNSLCFDMVNGTSC